MTDKELRKLSRADLVDIVYQLQQQQEAIKAEYERTNRELTDEIERLRKRLKSREIRISEAGTLADAIVSLTGILEQAQATADVYLQNIENMKKEEAEKLEAIKRVYREEVEKDDCVVECGNTEGDEKDAP